MKSSQKVFELDTLLSIQNDDAQQLKLLEKRFKINDETKDRMTASVK